MTTELNAIVGLGNPGDRYDRTRHNAGFWFLDLLAKAYGGAFRHERRLHGDATEVRLGDRRVRLLKPDTFVNESGQAVQALTHYFRLEPESVLVVYDELDLVPGVVRFKRGGGHGGHNGLRSIIAHLGTNSFPRLRIGIGHPGQKSAVTGHVLSRPSGAEQTLVDGAMDAALSLMGDFSSGHWDQAIKQLHTAAADNNKADH
ncbi:MAG: aminoacyl-tRNA hydrolase [Lysobacterales bacterium]